MSLRIGSLAPRAGSFLGPFLVGLAVHTQGLNLLDDGLWLLGGRMLTEGGALYRDLFTIYGPARYLVLAPFLLTIGPSAVALAAMKAVLDGIAGLLGWWWCRRLGAGRWAWLVPLGVIAIAPVYPRYLAAAALAIWAGNDPWTGRRALATGFFWGGLAAFGLDMAAYGAVILAGAWLAAGRPRGALGPLAGGAGAIVALVAVVAVLQGAADALWWDVVAYPATRFAGAMGVSWVGTLTNGTALGEVFAGRHTGEALGQAWPGHALLRSVGLRLMIAVVWLAPPALFAAGRRANDRRLVVLACLGFAGWATLSARGDVEHVMLVWWAVLLMTAILAGRFTGRGRLRAGLAGALLALALGPLAGERIWLAVNRDRPGLVRWERPAAGILLAEERRDALEEICAWLGREPDDGILVWPAQPGLHFLAGRPPALAQATLLPGEVRDPADLVRRLDAAAPGRMVLGAAWGLVTDVRSLRRLEPLVWSYLRENVRVEREVALTSETFRLARRVEGGRAGVLELPAAQRLPGAAQYVKSGTTPPVRPGVEILQTFGVRDFDLAGVALMFTAPGPFPYRIDFELGIVRLEPDGTVTTLAEVPVTISLDSQGQKHSFPFRPVAGTRGRTVGVRIRDLSQGERPFALLWHEPDRDAGGLDFHPGGQVFVNGRPVAADLAFTTW